MRHKNKYCIKHQQAFSLVELLVVVAIAGVLFGVAATVANDFLNSKELLDRNIELDSIRWYVRDRLDCKNTLGITKTTALPLNCNAFPKGTPIELRTRISSASPLGSKMSAVIANTRWNLRAYCENNSLVIDYAPKRPRAIDTNRSQLKIKPTDVLLPRAINPYSTGAASLPGSVGFAYMPNAFQGETAIQCPSTGAFGGLMGLAMVVVQSVMGYGAGASSMYTGLGGAFTSNSTSAVGVLKGLWGGGLQGGVAAMGGSIAMQQTAAITQSVVIDIVKNVGAAAIDSGALNSASVLTVQYGSLPASKPLTAQDASAAAKAAGVNTPDAATLAKIKNGQTGIGEASKVAGASDKKMTIGDKIDLEVKIATTEVNKKVDDKFSKVAATLSESIAKLPAGANISSATNAAVSELDRYLKIEASNTFNSIIDKRLQQPLKDAIANQINTAKQNVDAEFDKLEAKARNGGVSTQKLPDALKLINADKQKALDTLGNLEKTQLQEIDKSLVDVKSKFKKTMFDAANNSKTGIKAVLDQLSKDIQASKGKPLPSNNYANNFKVDPNKLSPPTVLGVPQPLDPYWADLFDGSATLCREEFIMNPMRDFAKDSNPCPFIAGGTYPFLAGIQNNGPLCCREAVSNTGQTSCTQTEFIAQGGAECSAPTQPLTGQLVNRSVVLPAFQAQGGGMAFGYTLTPSFGGIVWAGLVFIPPTPHTHGYGNGTALFALTTKQVYATAPVNLGGFLRVNASDFATNTTTAKQNSLCYYANKIESRSADWTGVSAQHIATTKSLCCPVAGIAP